MALARPPCCFLSLASSNSDTKSDHMSKDKRKRKNTQRTIHTAAICLRLRSKEEEEGSPERRIPQRSRSRRAAATPATNRRVMEMEGTWRRGREGAGEGSGFENVPEGAGRRSSSCCAMPRFFLNSVFPLFLSPLCGFFRDEGLLSKRVPVPAKIIQQSCSVPSVRWRSGM